MSLADLSLIITVYLWQFYIIIYILDNLGFNNYIMDSFQREYSN
jgi:hypothetical protein